LKSLREWPKREESGHDGKKTENVTTQRMGYDRKSDSLLSQPVK